MVGVAQLVRAEDCGSSGRGFKSPHSPQIEQEDPLAQRLKGFLIVAHTVTSFKVGFDSTRLISCLLTSGFELSKT